MVLPIVKYPNKILRTKGKDLTFPLSPNRRKLIKDMLDTVRKAGGVGLAAPQIGQSLNLIVVNLEHQEVPAFVLINPRIKSSSRKTAEFEEGCLSIPGVFGKLKRPEKITFEAADLTGKKLVLEVDGIVAEVIQHEIDHINGVLIIDKITEYTKGEELLKGVKE